MSDVIAEVISQKGSCAAGHRVGQKFTIGQNTQAGICSSAFFCLFPFAEVLRYDGSFPWSDDPNSAKLACPDPVNPVVFELRRSSKK